MCSAAAQYVLLFLILAVNSNKFSNFTELHTLTQATRSYVLLTFYQWSQRMSAVNGEVIFEDSAWVQGAV